MELMAELWDTVDASNVDGDDDDDDGEDDDEDATLYGDVQTGEPTQGWIKEIHLQPCDFIGFDKSELCHFPESVRVLKNGKQRVDTHHTTSHHQKWNNRQKFIPQTVPIRVPRMP